jgi:hypothetical protein
MYRKARCLSEADSPSGVHLSPGMPTERPCYARLISRPPLLLSAPLRSRGPFSYHKLLVYIYPHFFINCVWWPLTPCWKRPSVCLFRALACLLMLSVFYELTPRECATASLHVARSLTHFAFFGSSCRTPSFGGVFSKSRLLCMGSAALAPRFVGRQIQKMIYRSC